MTDHLAEYQGSRNKYHGHTFTGNQIFARTYLNEDYPMTNTGLVTNEGGMTAMTHNSSRYYSSTSGSASRVYGISLKVTPSGSNSADGSSGYGSKPPTVAVMWILRFI